MLVFRLARKRYSATLSGAGAALKGARWNSKGTELVYTAENRSLAMAEVLVHLSLAALPRDFLMLTIEVSDALSVLEISETDLPPQWNYFPYLNTTQKFGDDFVRENKYCVMKVPSVVTPGDFNFLLNPHHVDFNGIKIVRSEIFPFDSRLFH